MKKYYLIGIGGIGLSGIAKILIEQGHQVSGSDMNKNKQTVALENIGAKIYIGQKKENISSDIDAIIASSAIPEDNPEILAAKEKDIKIFHRDDFLPELTKNKKVIAIAGTHGKTTTSSIVSHLLIEAGFDPTFLVGGVLKNYGTNARAGKGEYFVIEADEFGNAFLGLSPFVAGITNIEYDHPDFFKNEKVYLESFQKFIDNILPNGYLIKNAEDYLSNLIKSDILTIVFSQKETSDYQIQNFIQKDSGSEFLIKTKQKSVQIISPLLGIHNAKNILVAYAIANILKISDSIFVSAILSFQGTGRRLEKLFESKKIRVFSDYAHHPTEVKTVLNSFPYSKNLIAVYQPHQFSRTKKFIEQYKNIFKNANQVVLLPIFKSRDKKDFGFSIFDLKKNIDHPNIEVCEDFNKLSKIIKLKCKNSCDIVLMTAGDANQYLNSVIKELQ